jgi:HD-GYP domain-containing protein (c-di-GMP phosphodiesterase class II)
LGAGIIVFFSSTLMLSGVLHLTKKQSLRSIWQEHFSWLLPYYLGFGLISFVMIIGYAYAGFIGVLAAIMPLLIIRLSQYQYIENTKSLVKQLHASNKSLEENNQTMSRINEDLLMSLANTIDLRDSYTLGHSENVAHLVTMIAEALGMPEEKVDVLQKSSMLHDIGKIGIPDSILFKSGKLTAEEFGMIMEHPTRGADILEVNATLRDLGPIVRYHHEHYDGSGYPDGLRGAEIPLEARILCFADSVQAMLSDRPYRKRMQLQDVIQEVKDKAGSHFDPEVAKAFLVIMENKPSEIEFIQTIGDQPKSAKKF